MSSKALPQYELVLPPTNSPLLGRYGFHTEPILELGDSNASESATLAAVRDALLPKLLSGELRVGEAAGLVGMPPASTAAGRRPS